MTMKNIIPMPERGVDIQGERSDILERVRKYAPKKLGHYKRAYAGKSLKAAVIAKCLDCTCDQTVEIRLCPCAGCPLWTYRPYQDK